MMAHNLSAHALSSALNHRSSPYMSQDHMLSSRHIPILSVPEILEAFHQAHPSSNNAMNLCSNSILRSIGSDPWELPELKWLDPAEHDNNVVASSENLVNEADKFAADHSLTSLAGPEKFSLDGGGGERWPFSALYAGDRVAANCASTGVDDDDSLSTQFSLQSMVTVSPPVASTGSSVLIKNNHHLSSMSTISNFVSKDFPSSSGSQVAPEWRSNTTATCSSGSQKRPAPSDRTDLDLSQDKSIVISDRSTFKAADNCLPERLASSYNEVSALTATPRPPEKRRRVQAPGGGIAAADGSSTPAAAVSAGHPEQKIIVNEKGRTSATTPTNDQTISPGRENSKKSSSSSSAAAAAATAAATAATVSDHEIHIWTERERRKKMNGMFSTLHSLLPHLTSKADKSTIVDEAINYIQSLEVTMKGLMKRKCETASCSSSAAGGMMPSSLALLQAAQNGGSAASMAAVAAEMDKLSPAMNLCGADVKPSPVSVGCSSSNPAAAAAAAARGGDASQKFQTLCSPNIVLNVCGTDAFVTVCSPRGMPGLLVRVLFVMESHSLHVLNAHISTTDETVLFMLHAQSTDPQQLANLDMLNLALQDLTNCITATPQ